MKYHGWFRATLAHTFSRRCHKCKGPIEGQPLNNAENCLYKISAIVDQGPWTKSNPNASVSKFFAVPQEWGWWG